MTESYRDETYGERRTFRGLEKFAINLRLQKAREEIADYLQQHVAVPVSILELGCGFYGNNLVMLQEEFPQATFTGCDLKVSETPQSDIQLFEANLETWRPEATVDIILSLAVAEHLLLVHEHFSLIAACLKPGGVAIVTTPSPAADFVLKLFANLGVFDKDEILDHKLYLTKRGIELMAANAGLILRDYHVFTAGLNQGMILVKE